MSAELVLKEKRGPLWAELVQLARRFDDEGGTVNRAMSVCLLSLGGVAVDAETGIEVMFSVGRVITEWAERTVSDRLQANTKAISEIAAAALEPAPVQP